MSEIVIPWATLTNPDELEEWIGDEDDRHEQAWEDHYNGVGKKWLIAAVSPDQCIFIAIDEHRSKTYPTDEDNWGAGAAEDIEEWVLGCFGDYTGLKGELVPREPIEFDLASQAVSQLLKHGELAGGATEAPAQFTGECHQQLDRRFRVVLT